MVCDQSTESVIKATRVQFGGVNLGLDSASNTPAITEGPKSPLIQFQGNGMQRFIIIRLFYAVLVLFAVSIIVFILARASGNPIDTMLPFDATIAQQMAFEKLWGLDKGLPEPVSYTHLTLPTKA